MSDHSKLMALALEVPEGIVAPAAYDDDRSYSQSEVKLLNFLEAATPAAILALIAENERLAKQVQLMIDQTTPLEPIPGDPMWSRRVSEDRLIAERDQLKAENEALRRGRYTKTPFAPFQESALGYTGCFICGGYTDHGGLPCPKMSPAAKALSIENQRLTPVEPLRVPHPLDAAMGKGEQS